MIKFKLYYDKDKETQWLNRMAAGGLAMTGFFAGFYRFEPCEKGKYVYQIDFGDKLFSVSEDYREFMDEAGIEIIQPWGFWIILRQSAEKGEFKLYSDIDSLMEHYGKIRNMFKAVTIIELICLFMVIFSAARTNEPWMWGGVFLLLAFVLGLAKITLHTGDIIRELRERGTGIEEPKNRNISALLVSGLLLNSCSLLIQESVSSYISIPIQVLAIVMMLVGIYRTGRGRK